MDELRKDGAEIIILFRESQDVINSAAALEIFEDIGARFQVWCADLGVFEYGYASLSWRLSQPNKIRSAKMLIRHLREDLSNCDYLIVISVCAVLTVCSLRRSDGKPSTSRGHPRRCIGLRWVLG